MTAAGTGKLKKSCFVIAPIGPIGSETRKRSDKVLKHIFRRALAEKYAVTRADDIDEAGMITSQVLRAVQDSHLVLADLTETNPNVLYELAVRHAIEKPVIHVIEPRLSKIPFDIAGFRTIEFDITDPDSIDDAVERLRKQAEQAESGKWGETPIKLANVMRHVEGDKPELLLLKQAVEGIASISARLGESVSVQPGWVYGGSLGKLSALAGHTGNPPLFYTDIAPGPGPKHMPLDATIDKRVRELYDTTHEENAAPIDAPRNRRNRDRGTSPGRDSK
jgi:hypothetical protein